MKSRELKSSASRSGSSLSPKRSAKFAPRVRAANEIYSRLMRLIAPRERSLAALILYRDKQSLVATAERGEEKSR